MRAFQVTQCITFLCLSLLLLSAAPAAALPDPSIRNWGSPPGSPPPWQTPDIWVDNDGDGSVNEPAEPARGISNRLFAKIRNLGSTSITNVNVRFAFAPYGLWAPGSLADFKEIGVVTVPTLGAMGSADAEKTIELEWDLSNLSEDNGGAWGGHTVGEFDHFCVLVTLTAAGDSNTANNIAQNNFFSVPIEAGLAQSLKFLVANPKNQQAAAEMIVRGLPENWRVRTEGLERGGRTILKAKEVRLVTLAFTPPPRDPERPANAHVDVSLRLDGEIVGGISFDAREQQAAAGSLFPPTGGSLSPYLIGTYDLRSRHWTTFQIVNPTGKPLRVLVAFFDDDEKPLGCVRDRLSPNDLLEIDARRHVKAPSGVVKIVSFDETVERPVAGVVGYQRTFARRFFSGSLLRGETSLFQIPAEILAGDMDMIRRACQ
jgi:hypothetical protein